MRKKMTLFAMVIALLFSKASQAQQWDKIDATTYDHNLALNKSATNKSVFAGTTRQYRPRYYEHYRKLKTAGVVLTSVGIASFVGGVALVAEGARRNNSYGSYDGYNDYYQYSGNSGEGDGMIVTGAFGIAGSVFALGGGITMWAIGGHHLRKMDRFSFQSKGNRIGLAYKF